MTATKSATVIAVVKASKAGVTCVVNGTRKVIGWDWLRRAAAQDDRELADSYANILKEAKRLASLEKNLTIRIVNRTNTPHGYTAELYDVAGEFVSGRIVAADFGLAGSYEYAKRDAQNAIAVLDNRGYVVQIEE